MTRLLGNPAAQHALDHGDVLLMIGTDFPYREWYPNGKTVIQVDADGEHIGRRVHVHLGLVGDAAATLRHFARSHFTWWERCSSTRRTSKEWTK
ncbi:MAG: hypothetical protein ACJ72W_05190 [Actinoallomurus sp.]